MTDMARYRMIAGRKSWAILHNAECESILPVACDAIVTDPPYEIGKAWRRGFHDKRAIIMAVECAMPINKITTAEKTIDATPGFWDCPASASKIQSQTT